LGLAAMGWVLSDIKKNAWIAGALVSASKSWVVPPSFSPWA
jgi:hypothetical protein